MTHAEDELRNGEEYDITQPLNGDNARLFGLEFAFQNRFSFLPEPLDGFGVYANYTFTNSRADLPGREGTLPGQAKHSGNLAFSCEKFGFSGRASLTYQGRYLGEVAEKAPEDIHFEKRLQFDLSLSQRITRNIRVFADLINVNNEPYVVYQGVRRQPIQNEIYSWWGIFGLKFDF